VGSEKTVYLDIFSEFVLRVMQHEEVHQSLDCPERMQLLGTVMIFFVRIFRFKL